MKYSREYIVKRAFDVFMTKGYDSTSISVLQEELGMSRGAMYRYFRNKEELFYAVIDEYFFKTFDKLLYNVDRDLTLAEFLEVVHRRQKIVINAFTRAGVTHIFFLNYTALMIQAAKYYPEFVKRFRIISNQLLSYWRRAILNSIDAGEIRSDVDIEILCSLFNNISVKETDEDDCDEKNFTVNILRNMERKKEIMDYLYSLIKV